MIVVKVDARTALVVHDEALTSQPPLVDNGDGSDDPAVNAESADELHARTFLLELSQDRDKHIDELLSAEREPLDDSAVADRLGIRVGEVARLRDSRQLLAIERADGTRMYPSWQFVDGNATVLPGLPAVLSALRVSPPVQAAWFLSDDPPLHERPLDALRHRRMKETIRAAEAYGEQGAA